MSAISAAVSNAGVAVFAISMFFSLCQPLNKMLPKAVAVGFIMIVAGAVLA
jgi:hypothetical protein